MKKHLTAFGRIFLLMVILALPALADGPSTAWIYKSDQYNFSLTLPDSVWVERPSTINGVAGFLKKGYAMRADIFVVTCESDEAFEKIARKVKKDMQSYVPASTFEQGKTESGHHYQLGLGTEFNEHATNGISLVQSLVWIESRNIIVRVCFQGESVDRPTYKGVDTNTLQVAGRAICLSPN